MSALLAGGGRRRLWALVLFAVAAAFLASPAAAQEPAAAGCVNDCECPKGELCVAPGSCELALCPLIFDPVCGFDGMTYSNSCVANAQHVKVLHPGACAETCGGIQGKLCPEGQLCDLPEGMCRGADLQGICKPRPEVCTRDFRPVCGCDGKTYGNDCTRLAAGVQKAHDGECREEYGGCRSNADCDRAEFCAFRVGTCAAPGRCEPRPQACILIFRPVCGCDGQTYSNSCFAAQAGVSVRSQGACP